MPRNLYQYETSPRKYEPEYTPKKTTRKNVEKRQISKNRTTKTKYQTAKNKKVQEKKKQAKQIIIVAVIFGMLLAVSYREISIMEMFNQKKKMENNLAVIEKENGQVEKSIREVESTLDWNKIKQVATDELGMKTKSGLPLELEKSDNVETENKLIKEEKTNWLEEIIKKIIIK